MRTQPELTRTARLERLVPAAAWLFLSALGSIAGLRRFA